jgi:integrase
MRGQIKKRYENSWTIILELPRDPATGKRRQQWITVKGTKHDAERRMHELLQQIDSGGFVKPSKLTVRDFMRRWIQDYAMVHVRPVTAEGYNKKVEKHIIPSLGHIAACDLQPSHLQGFYRGKLNSGLSPRTVQHLHRILHNALSHAVKWGLAGRNVAEAVDPPRAANKEMRTLSPEGVKRLLEASGESMYYPLIHLAVYTGLRRSELLGLRWRNVDLDMSALSVVQVLHYLKGPRIVFQEPKSQKGKRQVALSPVAVVALREYRERQALEYIMAGRVLTQDDLVFSKTDGSPFLPNSVTHAFTAIVRRIGLAGIRFHDLRHTHASLMLRQGIHPKIVSERLGHATVGITLDTYSHVTPGLQEAAARRFEEGLLMPSPGAPR